MTTPAIAMSSRRLPFRPPALAAVVLACLPAAACTEAPQLVAQDPQSGFALYRSGRLGRAGLEALCAAGVEEYLVLDGTALEQECAMRVEVCPELRIRYDFAQEEDTPVSEEFLHAFGAWIEEARAEGRKVGFRCRHGWHRTGRLAAYYRLRFEGASAEAAIDEMHLIGGMMWRHPTLDPQVEAYADLIAGRPCVSATDVCPHSGPDPGLRSGRFPADACDLPSP